MSHTEEPPIEERESRWCDACKQWLELGSGFDNRLTANGGHEWDDYTCACRCEDRIETQECHGPVYDRAEALRRGLGQWSAEFPPRGMADGTRYLVRGHGDPESEAIRVQCVIARRTGAEMAANSVLRPLRYSNMYDIIDAGGNPRTFERRPIYEMQGALWKLEVKDVAS